MQNNIDKIFVGFGAQPVLVGLRATEDTVAGAVGLRFDLNIDNSLFQLRSPVIGMIFVNENYLKSFPDLEINFILAHECAHILKSHVLSKAFWTLLETIANGPRNENRAVVESIKLVLALGSRDYLPPNASSLRNNEYEADAIGVSITRNLRSAISCLTRLSGNKLDAPSHQWELFDIPIPAMTLRERIHQLKSSAASLGLI